MFGKNPLRPVVKDTGATLSVHSIFETIQGEGPLAGAPSVFVRLWGCHLHCTFCDTDFESVNDALTIDRIVAKVAKQVLVVITGGEPLRQNIAPLCCALVSAGHHVQIETAGNLPFQDSIPPYGVDVVISPKTHSIHESLLPVTTAFKYIISAKQILGEDGLPITNTQDLEGKSRPLARPTQSPDWHIIPVYLQPMDEYSDEANKVNRALCVALSLKHGYRISLQQHKILGIE